MTEKHFAESKLAKAAGWHSKRHKTRAAQDAARERYQQEHGKKARQRKAAERAARKSNDS